MPDAPALWTVNEIKLIAPLAVGKVGTPPPGNRKYVLKPTVAIPELTILKVWADASVPPVQVIVYVPLFVILWSSFDKSSVTAVPAVVNASVVIPTEIPVKFDPSP